MRRLTSERHGKTTYKYPEYTFYLGWHKLKKLLDGNILAMRLVTSSIDRRWKTLNLLEPHSRWHLSFQNK